MRIFSDLLDWWKESKIVTSVIIAGSWAIGVVMCSTLVIYLFNGAVYGSKIVTSNRVVTIDTNRVFILHTDNSYDDCPIIITRKMVALVNIDGDNIPTEVYLSNDYQEGKRSRYIVSFARPAGIWDGDWTFIAQVKPVCPLTRQLFTKSTIVTYNFPLKVVGTNTEPPDASDVINFSEK